MLGLPFYFISIMVKKIHVLTLFFIVFISSVSAQDYGSKEHIAAYRKIQTIEQKFLSENTDEQAIELIKTHKQAKKSMEGKLMLMKGYGDAAKDKKALNKFREKCEKSDAKFKELSDEEKRTLKEKQDYLITVSDDYKRLLPDAYPTK